MNEYKPLTREEENDFIQTIREYYRQEYQNGESEESFLIWLSERIKEIYGFDEAVY